MIELTPKIHYCITQTTYAEIKAQVNVNYQ